MKWVELKQRYTTEEKVRRNRRREEEKKKSMRERKIYTMHFWIVAIYELCSIFLLTILTGKKRKQISWLTKAN